MPLPYFIPNDMQASVGKLERALGGFITPERLERLRSVVTRRSRCVLSVFESTNHSHNISAVLRTVDALGFQDAFFVYTDLAHTRFRVRDSVERGSSDWLCVRRANSIDQIASYLKKQNYKILLVSLPSFYRTSRYFKQDIPHFSIETLFQGSSLPSEFLGDIALVFGNEKYGLSEEWVEHADAYLSIRMDGFVESLNLSVCAGILLHALRTRLVDSRTGTLCNTTEQSLLLESWLARDLVNVVEIVTRVDSSLLPYLNWVKPGAFFQPFKVR